MSQIQDEMCHACGGPLITKRVEKLLRGGVHTAIVEATADVCQHCGEQLFSAETIRHFEDIRKKLANQETSDFLLIGQSFQVPQESQATA